MLKRYLFNELNSLALSRNKMAFISGPRQCGKTTFSKFFLKNNGAYFNWDDLRVRKLLAMDPSNLTQDKDTVVLDEIHKAKFWKRILKGIYDTLTSQTKIIVTGSARLNVYKKGGDSLMGRYFHFRFHPLSLGELVNSGRPVLPDDIFETPTLANNNNKVLESLFQYSGFPEPFLEKNPDIHRLWQRGRHDKIVREDLRDLSQIRELGHVEMLMALLPSRVASPLSMKSLQEDLEVSFETVRRWIIALHELYYLFELRPYSKSVTRSIKKEPKLYLWDWTEVEDKGARFENMVALHLLKACHYWTDIGKGEFELYYLRNKEKQEIDFLVLRDKKPWLAVEAKLTDEKLSPNWSPFLRKLRLQKFFQVVMSPIKTRTVEVNGIKGEIVSALNFLSRLP